MTYEFLPISQIGKLKQSWMSVGFYSLSPVFNATNAGSDFMLLGAFCVASTKVSGSFSAKQTPGPCCKRAESESESASQALPLPYLPSVVGESLP